MKINSDYLIGIGIGIIIGVLLINLTVLNFSISANVEKEARKMGMVYPSEIKILDFIEGDTND